MEVLTREGGEERKNWVTITLREERRMMIIDSPPQCPSESFLVLIPPYLLILLFGVDTRGNQISLRIAVAQDCAVPGPESRYVAKQVPLSRARHATP